MNAVRASGPDLKWMSHFIQMMRSKTCLLLPPSFPGGKESEVMSCYCLHYGVSGRLQKQRAPVPENSAPKSCLLFVQRPKLQIPSVFFRVLGRFG